jgi:thioredoxin 1
MSLCCIGGVCIPYTALLPLIAMALQWIARPLAKMGLLPAFIAIRLGIPLNANNESSEKSCSCCSSTTAAESETTSLADTDSNTADAGQVLVLKTREEYSKLVSSNATVFIKFTAEWCKPCKIIQPIYESLAASTAASAPKNPVRFTIVDVDELESVSAENKVAMMPTFVAYRNGVKVSSMSGSNEEKLKAFVQTVLDGN